MGMIQLSLRPLLRLNSPGLRILFNKKLPILSREPPTLSITRKYIVLYLFLVVSKMRCEIVLFKVVTNTTLVVSDSNQVFQYYINVFLNTKYLMIIHLNIVAFIKCINIFTEKYYLVR